MKEFRSGYRIDHETYVYLLKAWKPLKLEEFSQEEKAAGVVYKADDMLDSLEEDENDKVEEVEKDSDSDSEYELDTSGDEDLLYKYKDELGSYYNMPHVVSPEKVIYMNRAYSSYKYGKYGWLSKLLEPLIQESMALPNGRVVGEDPEIWISDYAVTRTRNLATPKRNAFSEIQNSEPFAWLLMHVDAEGDYSETIGHPGIFYEVRVFEERQIFEVYALEEVGRRNKRSLVFTSDGYHSLKYLNRYVQPSSSLLILV